MISNSVRSGLRRRAVKVALIVGSLLALINYGDKLYLGHMAPVDWLKLGLTYVVPFGVSYYSALTAANKAAASEPIVKE